MAVVGVGGAEGQLDRAVRARAEARGAPGVLDEQGPKDSWELS